MRLPHRRRAARLAAAEAVADARREAFFGPLLAAMEADRSSSEDADGVGSPSNESTAPTTPVAPDAPTDPLSGPAPDWHDQPALCADLVAAELGIDPTTGRDLEARPASTPPLLRLHG